MKYLKKYQEVKRINEAIDGKITSNDGFKHSKSSTANVDVYTKKMTLFDLPIIDSYKLMNIPTSQVPVKCGLCDHQFKSVIDKGSGDNAEKQVSALYGTSCPGCEKKGKDTKIGFKVEYARFVSKEADFFDKLGYNKDTYYLFSTIYDEVVEDLLPEDSPFVQEWKSKSGFSDQAAGGTPPPPPPPPNNPNNNTSNDKLKFAKASPVAPPTPPNWVKNPTVWSSDELVRLLEKYLSVFASIYAKCFSERYAVPNAVVEVKGRLETLLRELKTKDPLRIEDAVRVFFDNVSPKLSERNISSWLQSSDGRKWGEAITRFEQLCSYILD